MADPNRDMAQFTLSNEGAAFYKLHITYREVDVRILFPRAAHGKQELANLSGTIPRLMAAAIREAHVREETANLDSEIEDLLGDSE